MPGGPQSPPGSPRVPHLTGVDVARLCEPVVLDEELACGQRLCGAWHSLWEETLDLLDCPHIECALLGPHAPLWGRICILSAVEATRLREGQSSGPVTGREGLGPPAARAACLSGHTRWLRLRLTYCRMPLATSE